MSEVTNTAITVKTLPWIQATVLMQLGGLPWAVQLRRLHPFILVYGKCPLALLLFRVSWCCKWLLHTHSIIWYPFQLHAQVHVHMVVISIPNSLMVLTIKKSRDQLKAVVRADRLMEACTDTSTEHVCCRASTAIESAAWYISNENETWSQIPQGCYWAFLGNATYQQPPMSSLWRGGAHHGHI